jgi:ribonucleoside-triphosphate reductase
LLNRYNTLNNEKNPSDFLLNYEFDLWKTNFTDAKSLEEIFKHGTLSIGFIGLDDAIRILFGKSYFQDEKLYGFAREFVLYMRKYVDNLRETQKLNWSLLATSGELISGRFPTKDKEKGYINESQDKEYYTNSFHIPVDSHLSAFDKIKFEGPFHAMCNGGCITYVELGEAPLDNTEALDELVKCAIESGTSYLGFNFPLDICKDCNTSGIFDECPRCKSRNITRLRRVSGYLEVLDYFTSGKKNEEKNRRKNSCTLQ